MYKVTITGGGVVKVYLVQSTSMSRAVGKALRAAFDEEPSNPLNIKVERATEGLLLEQDIMTKQG